MSHNLVCIRANAFLIVYFTVPFNPSKEVRGTGRSLELSNSLSVSLFSLSNTQLIEIMCVCGFRFSNVSTNRHCKFILRVRGLSLAEHHPARARFLDR